MQDLVAAGFMKSIGKPSFCIDEFFTITPTGKIALSGEIQILLNKQKEAKQCPKCKGELPPDGICICQELHELLDNEMDPEAALANGKPEGVL